MHLKTRINLIRVIIFSDRCGAQYKSKLPFHYLQNMGTDIPGEHCYHGSWLEKNLCDSLGGAVKSAEKRDVKAWNATIRNTASLLQLFSSFFLSFFFFCQRKLQVNSEVCGHRGGFSLWRKRTWQQPWHHQSLKHLREQELFIASIQLAKATGVMKIDLLLWTLPGVQIQWILII